MMVKNSSFGFIYTNLLKMKEYNTNFKSFNNNNNNIAKIPYILKREFSQCYLFPMWLNIFYLIKMKRIKTIKIKVTYYKY